MMIIPTLIITLIQIVTSIITIILVTIIIVTLRQHHMHNQCRLIAIITFKLIILIIQIGDDNNNNINNNAEITYPVHQIQQLNLPTGATFQFHNNSVKTRCPPSRRAISTYKKTIHVQSRSNPNLVNWNSSHCHLRIPPGVRLNR